MQFLNVLVLGPLVLFSPLASSNRVSTSAAAPTSTPSALPCLNKLFTATLELGKPLKPIPVPAGIRLIEPITNGTISGPNLTATVTGGTAFPIFYNDMTIERPDIVVSGNTDKNGSFFATLKGVGTPMSQYVSIEIDVSPPYAGLNESFILGEIIRQPDGTTVVVDGYLVEKATK